MHGLTPSPGTGGSVAGGGRVASTMGMGPVHFDLHNALTAWQWGPFSVSVLMALAVIAYLYAHGTWRLAARGRRWPMRRSLPFVAGLVSIDLALQSPVASFTSSYFQAHVVQHLLLMAVAPPLLALGAPSTLLLQSASRANKKRWLTVLRSRPFAVATHPAPVWFAYFGVMFAFFLSPLINFAMEHMALMDVINVTFLLGGCFYWWPMVGIDPIVHWRMGYGARMANLALGAPFEAFLGIAIMYEHGPIASMYTLASTHAGGALLWAATEVSTFVGIAPVFWQWVKADERAGARADARAERPEQVPAASQSPFKPLLQPGNASWEAMWRAKAGYVPSVATAPARLEEPDVHRGARAGPQAIG